MDEITELSGRRSATSAGDQAGRRCASILAEEKLARQRALLRHPAGKRKHAA